MRHTHDLTWLKVTPWGRLLFSQHTAIKDIMFNSCSCFIEALLKDEQPQCRVTWMTVERSVRWIIYYFLYIKCVLLCKVMNKMLVSVVVQQWRLDMNWGAVSKLIPMQCGGIWLQNAYQPDKMCLVDKHGYRSFFLVISRLTPATPVTDCTDQITVLFTRSWITGN